MDPGQAVQTRALNEVNDTRTKAEEELHLKVCPRISGIRFIDYALFVRLSNGTFTIILLDRVVYRSRGQSRVI